ncbi:amidohydrolase family protein [Pleionea mediterranea]|uniref:Amidohydrolase family protein n=1 Tax=Pleionea mediterranea TaxID=523701 RepID=A0A316FZM5_9GAMM|nr:amidohydrolase family protein [Pleionea mediterranea]PWK52990.1 amidohydrolase family protein [Pleionea mediterranea]
MKFEYSAENNCIGHKMLKQLTALIMSMPVLVSASDIYLKNVTIISPNNSSPVKDAYVLIADDKISTISKSPINIPSNTKIINGEGRYLIPGLIDSHVHVSEMPGMIKGEKSDYLKDLEKTYFLQQPKSYLYFGITRIQDLAGDNRAIQQFQNSDISPSLSFCGMIPIADGYPVNVLGLGDPYKAFPYLVIEPNDSIPEGVNRAEHTPERIVDKIARDGGSCVKLFFEDGFGTESHWPLMKDQTVKAIITEAKKHGLSIYAHANAVDMQNIALKYDIDVIAHGLWNWNEHAKSENVPNAIQATLDTVIEKQIAYQPTFNVMDGLKALTVPNTLSSKDFSFVVPPSILSWYQSEDAQWFKQEIINDFGNPPLPILHKIMDGIISRGERSVQYLNQKNYPLVLASDTPSSPTYAAQPGLSSFLELKHMHSVGVSLGRILEAATINNAKLLNVDKIEGTVEAGKRANLLLLKRNPLETIDAYNSIEFVIIDGNAYERERFMAK